MSSRSSHKQRRPTPPHSSGPRAAVAFELEADVLEGLERFGQTELHNNFVRYVKFDGVPREGKIRFSYTGNLHALLGLRSMVAVYLVRRFAVPRPRALLGHQHLTALLDQIGTVQALAPADTYRTLRLSAAGEDTSVMQRLKDELGRLSGLALAADEGDLLLRIRRATDGMGWETLVRITPRPLATRAWRVCNMPGALNATLAHAMVYLSEPHPDDRVVNLACGSGTLLVERLALGPARSAIGCDTDLAALECARRNLRAAGFDRQVRLERWDAADLPLDDRSATVICADLPFGQLVGSHRENEALYPRVMAEAARVAAAGARMVLLTHEVRLLERVAGEYERVWRVKDVLRVRAGGMTPRVYLFQRL